MVEPMTPMPAQSESTPRTMSFPDGMKQILNNKRIARISWANSDYCLLKDGWLCIFIRKEFHTWSVNQSDMEGEDWVVVKEAN